MGLVNGGSSNEQTSGSQKTQITDAAGNPLITAPIATAQNQTTQISQLGALNEAAPASDTASSGLNGRLQRIAQRLSSIFTALSDASLVGKITNGTNTADTFAADTGQNGLRTGVSRKTVAVTGTITIDMDGFASASISVSAISGNATITGSNDPAFNNPGALPFSSGNTTLVSSSIMTATGGYFGNVPYRYLRITQGTSITATVTLSTVPFSVSTAVAQTGNWTVNPGNTANTTPWLFSANSLPLPNGAATNSGITGVSSKTLTDVDASISSRLKPADTLNAVGSINNPLPAGSNIIGKFGIDQTIPGNTNKVNIGNDGVVASAPSSLPSSGITIVSTAGKANKLNSIGACNIYSVFGFNDGADAYLHIVDSAADTSAGSAPVLPPIKIFADENFEWTVGGQGVPVRFTNGIHAYISTDSDTKVLSATNDCFISIARA